MMHQPINRAGYTHRRLRALCWRLSDWITNIAIGLVAWAVLIHAARLIWKGLGL